MGLSLTGGWGKRSRSHRDSCIHSNKFWVSIMSLHRALASWSLEHTARNRKIQIGKCINKTVINWVKFHNWNTQGNRKSYIKIACCVREACFRKSGLGKLRRLHLNWTWKIWVGWGGVSSVETNRIGQDPWIGKFLGGLKNWYWGGGRIGMRAEVKQAISVLLQTTYKVCKYLRN